MKNSKNKQGAAAAELALKAHALAFDPEFLAKSPLGYEQLQVTKRGPDRGIDGFGLFRQGVVTIRSAFQAKRWRQNLVGRPEIDKFRGAIQGDYDHGVFLNHWTIHC